MNKEGTNSNRQQEGPQATYVELDGQLLPDPVEARAQQVLRHQQLIGWEPRELGVDPEKAGGRYVDNNGDIAYTPRSEKKRLASYLKLSHDQRKRYENLEYIEQQVILAKELPYSEDPVMSQEEAYNLGLM